MSSWFYVSTPTSVADSTRERKQPYHSPTDVALMVCLGDDDSIGTSSTNATASVGPLNDVRILGPQADGRYDQADVTWKSYVSDVSQTVLPSPVPSSHRGNFVHYVATTWQGRINAGESLPQLYIVHVAQPGLTMQSWAPYDDQNLGHLYDYARHVVSLAVKNLRAQRKTVRVTGIVWSQWKTDARFDASVQAYPARVSTLIDGMSEAVGCDAPFYMWYPRRAPSGDMTASRIVAVQKALVDIRASNPQRFALIDVGSSPWYGESDSTTRGVFGASDGAYLNKVYEWAAQQCVDSWTSGGLGGLPTRYRTVNTPTVQERKLVAQALGVRTELANVAAQVSNVAVQLNITRANLGTAAAAADSPANELLASGAACLDLMYPSVPMPQFIASTYKRLSYGANVLRLVRASDGAVANVGCAAYGSVDELAIQSFAGGNVSGITAAPIDQVSRTAMSFVQSRSMDPTVSLWGATAVAQTVPSPSRASVYYRVGLTTLPSNLVLGNVHTSMWVSAEYGFPNGLGANTSPAWFGSSTSGVFTKLQNSTESIFVKLSGTDYYLAAKDSAYALANTSSDAFKVFVLRRDGASAELLVNGTRVGGNTAVSSSHTLACQYMGGSYSSVDRYLHGHISEMIHWNTSLSDEQVAALVASAKLIHGI